MFKAEMRLSILRLQLGALMGNADNAFSHSTSAASAM